MPSMLKRTIRRSPSYGHFCNFLTEDELGNEHFFIGWYYIRKSNNKPIRVSRRTNKKRAIHFCQYWNLTFPNKG